MLAVFGSKDEHLVDTGGRAYRGRAWVQQLLDAGLEEEKVTTGTFWMGIDKVSARSQCNERRYDTDNVESILSRIQLWMVPC